MKEEKIHHRGTETQRLTEKNARAPAARNVSSLCAPLCLCASVVNSSSSSSLK